VNHQHWRLLPNFLGRRQLSNPGVDNQSEAKSHISYCVTAKSPTIHTGTHEHHPISSSLAHTPKTRGGNRAITPPWIFKNTFSC